MKLWLTDVIKQPLVDCGSFVGGPPRLVWHTTEGASYPGPQIYHSTNPHFTCDVKKRRTYQHVALNKGSMALKHPAGTVDTNRLSAIQVELVGFSALTGKWPKEDYDYIAHLAHEIESAVGIPHKAADFGSPKRMTAAQWKAFSGHCGHVHVPSNDHTDPGIGFRIDLVLGGAVPTPTPVPPTYPTVRIGDHGEAVHHLQADLRGLGYKVSADGLFGAKTRSAVVSFQRKSKLSADGVVGPNTWKAIQNALRRH